MWLALLLVGVTPILGLFFRIATSLYSTVKLAGIEKYCLLLIVCCCCQGSNHLHELCIGNWLITSQESLPHSNGHFSLANVMDDFYCVKYPYLVITNAYLLAGANKNDQTKIFLK